MEYNLWKSVLLDWVNSTGFLVQNHENLGDTNIDTFFEAFKRQIKSTHIKSENVISFVREYYKDFYLKLDEKNTPPVGEYVYFYSLFLHFACVLHADTGIQQICNNMVRKNQELIEKFLDYLFKVGKCERAIVQTAIEEAENCDLQLSQQSPITRNVNSLLSNTSPQTPRSRMMNTWNLENRNLKAQLETERFERGYLEMQLNQCEKKLMKLDDDYKEAIAQNNFLKKQIQSLDEHDQLNQIAQTDVTVKQLRREIEEKENELFKLTVTCNEAKDDIEILKEKLQYAETQIKSLNMKLLETFTEAETFKNQLDEREKMISYMNNNNKELSDLLKELQSNSKKQDFDSSASYDLLNSTANDLNSSSFMIAEENLASAVVDVRLLDQQKQNLALTESINRLQTELSAIQEEATRLYKLMVSPSDELPSLNVVFSILSDKYHELSNTKQEQINELKTQSFEIASLNEVVSRLECTIASNNKEMLEISEQLKESREQLTLIRKEKDSLQERTEKLENGFDEQNKKYNALVEEKMSLVTKSEEYINNIEELKVSLTTNQDEMRRLSETLTSKDQEIEQLNKKLKETGDELSLLEKIKVSLTERVEKLEQDSTEQRTEFETLFAQKTDLENTVEQYSTNIEQLKECLEKAQGENSYLTASHSIKEQENMTLNSNLLEKNEQLTKIMKEKELLEERLLKLENDSTEQMKVHNALVEEKEMLNAKIEQFTSNVAQLEETLSRLREENKAMQELTNTNEVQSNELKAQSLKIASLNEAVSKLESTMADKNEEMEQIIEQLKETNEQLTMTKKEKDLLRERKDQLEIDIVEQHKEYDALIEMKTSLVAKTEEFSENITLLQEENKRLSTVLKDNQSLNEQLVKLQSDSTEQMKVYNALVDEKEMLNAKIELFTSNIAQLEENLSKLQEDSKAMQELTNTNELQSNELKAKSLKIVSLNEMVSKLECTITSKIDEIIQITEKLKGTSEQLALIQTEKDLLQKRIEKLENDIDDQRKKYDKSVDENTYLMTKVEEYTKKIEELQVSLTTNQDEKMVLSETIASKVQEIEQFTKQLKETADKISSLEKVKESLNERVNELERESAEHRTKYEELIVQKTDLENTVKEYSANIEQLNESLVKVQNEVKDLTESHKSKEQENVSLNGKLMETNKQLSSIMEEKHSLNDQLVKLENDSTEQMKVHNALVEEKKTLNAKIEQFTSNIADLEENLLKLQEENKAMQELTNTNEVQSNELNAQSLKIASLNEAVNKLESTITDKNEEMKQIIEQLKETNEQLTMTKEEKDLLRERKDQLEIDIVEQRKEYDALVEEKTSLVVKTEEYSKNISLLQEENEKLSSVLKDNQSLNEQLVRLENNSTEQMKVHSALVDEKEMLNAKIEQFTSNVAQLEETLSRLREENKVLIESSTNKEQLLTLNEQIVRLEKSHNERIDLWRKEKDGLIQDVKIYRAKLMKEREAAEQKEKEYKIMRNEYQEKLDLMKEKMKTLYKEEMAKVQDKHELQLNELVTENRRQVEKLIFYDERMKEFSSQIHSLNEEKLMLLKEHEIMKSKLRTYEIDSTLNRGNATNGSAMFFDKFRGGNFRMEDEEGELFDNTYLDELKRGSNREAGRESITLDEIRRRNSMVPPHLRSSYMPQYSADEAKGKENPNSLDDSMFSTASEAGKRGTAYKRPGPPTPSKNGGRLSLGGGDLPRGDILRESNGRPSISGLNGALSKAAKKSTPGKFSRIFSTSKIKDEGKENIQLSSRNTLQNLQKLFFSTSTPRRRPTRPSSLPKFEIERITSFGLMNTSVSKIERKTSVDPMRLGSLINQTKKMSRKILGSIDKKPKNYDSTPEYEQIHQDSTQLATSRKPFIKKQSSILKKKAIRNRIQKEKRFAAYDKMRRISKVERPSGETYSLSSVVNFSGATYNVDEDINDITYESDILNFQSEVNQCQGPVEIVIDNYDDEIDFEKLCIVKKSDCPFEDTEKIGDALASYQNDDKHSTKLLSDGCSNTSPQSINSEKSANSPTRMSSHCSRNHWNQHKIPKIETFKAEKKQFDNDSHHSSRSNHSSQSLITTVKSFHSNVSIGWHDLPSFVQYYIIAITFCFISILHYQLSH